MGAAASTEQSEPPDDGGPPHLIKRLTRSRPAWILAGGGGLATLVYAAVIEPRWLQAIAYTLLVPKLPDALAGVRIAHLTDFHVGMRGTPPSLLERAVAQARAWRPDLALLTGDFVHGGRWVPEADLFRDLAAEVPTFAVLGNHDSWVSRSETDRVADALRESGVSVLRNEATTVTLANRGQLALVGVDDPSFQFDDLDRAMADLPTAADPNCPTILLAHAPEMADRVPEGRFALIASGHTHGGQIHASPGQHRTIFEFGMLAGGLLSPYPRGPWLVRDNPLYVNSGLGLSGIPLRFRARPEAVLFILQPAPDTGSPPTNHFERLPYPERA